MDQQPSSTNIDEQDNVCIDYISNLPNELRGIIVAQALTAGGEIKPSELCEYLLVSHLWHETVLQHAHALQVVSESDDDLGKNDHVLKKLAPNIASLHVRFHAIPAYCLLQQARFSSLRSLNLHYESQLEERATVLSSLATVQSTLTHLKVMMRAWSWDEMPAYAIGDILKTLPHLISLTCCNIGCHFDAAPTTCPSLKELKLVHFHHCFDPHDIDDLTKRLPSLEVLILHPCDDIAALPTIQNNCPKLKSIIFNNCGYPETLMQRITYKGINSREPTSGDHDLQLLRVDHGYEENLLVGHISGVITSITRNSHSLQALHLRYESEADITDHRSLYADVTFSHLTSYTHEIFSDEDMILAMDLIRRSPQLRIIELHKGYPEYEDDNDSTRSIPSSHRHDDLSQVFTVMSGIPHLEVADVQVKGDNATTGVEQFLFYHGSIDSKIRQLYIPKSFHFSTKTLNCVTRLSRLEHLTMKPLFQEWTDCWVEAVRVFLEKLAERCPCLHSLKLYDIHQRHLQGLTRFSNLKSLWLKMSLTHVSDLLPLTQLPKLDYLDVDSRFTLVSMYQDGDEVATTLKNRFHHLRIY